MNEEHPKGALVMTLIYGLLIAAIWFSMYALLLQRG
jgi:hypothetical protein